jgi:hypothetical protein
MWYIARAFSAKHRQKTSAQPIDQSSNRCFIWMVLVVWSTKLMGCTIGTLMSEHTDTKPGRNGLAPSLRGERPMIKVCPSRRQSSQFRGHRCERHVSSCSATDPGFLPSRGNVNISTVANIFNGRCKSRSSPLSAIRVFSGDNVELRS